jgi:hypothetical protein
MHAKDGTPLKVSEKCRPPKSVDGPAWFEMKEAQRLARIELLEKTNAVVRMAVGRLDQVVTPRATLGTPIPPGMYIYLIAVADSKVFKLGFYKIKKTEHMTGCFRDRYWSDQMGALKVAPDLGPHFDGEWRLDRLDLTHYVKASWSEEQVMQAELRKLARELDFLPCLGKNEFHDRRLMKKAKSLMIELAARAAKAPTEVEAGTSTDPTAAETGTATVATQTPPTEARAEIPAIGLEDVRRVIQEELHRLGVGRVAETEERVVKKRRTYTPLRQWSKEPRLG